MVNTAGAGSSAVGFSVVRKGFDRAEVTATVERLEAEAALLRADRDAAVTRTEAALADVVLAREEIDTLRAKIGELNRNPVNEADLSQRLSTMLDLARAEAESVTREAGLDAERIRAEAEDDAWRVREESERRVREEAERVRRDAREEAERLRTEATEEAHRLRTEAAADVERIRAEARSERQSAADTLTEMRRRSRDLDARRREILDAAHTRAQQIDDAARRERERADFEAAQNRATIDEDHRLASDARRLENLEYIATQRDNADRDYTEIVEAAKQQADRLLAEAHQFTEELKLARNTVMSELASARARLEQIPGQTDSYDTQARDLLDQWHKRINSVPTAAELQSAPPASNAASVSTAPTTAVPMSAV